jgi:hypothetical protein
MLTMLNRFFGLGGLAALTGLCKVGIEGKLPSGLTRLDAVFEQLSSIFVIITRPF